MNTYQPSCIPTWKSQSAGMDDQLSYCERTRTLIEPQTHIHVISQSLEVLREILELPEQDEFSLMRAHAHLSAIKHSSEKLKEWAKAKQFIDRLAA
jgi:hypothetical protein